MQHHKQVIRNVLRRGSSSHKMKPGSVQAVLRRSLTNTPTTPRKGSSSPERGAPLVIAPGPLIRLCLHLLACIASLVIGFRLSRETLLVLVQPEVAILKPPLTRLTGSSTSSISSELDVGIKFPYVVPSGDPGTVLPETKSSRVHVGRHEILIRPWPHPDDVELHKAHALLERVQREQRSLYGPRNWKTIIAITPTFARTFQAIHLSSLMHTLRAVPGPVIWIVVEAGGRSNDTAAILASSNLNFVHLGVTEPMPLAWEQRRRMETRLRVEGLKHVREQKLEGMLVFADDSNVHSLQMFDEVQKVNWVGALSVGLLQSSSGESSSQETGSTRLPVQGPACNETCSVIGWHALRASPVDDAESESLLGVAGGITDVATHLEWSGFVMSSRAVGEEVGEEVRPEWINEWGDWVGEDESSSSPLRLVKDQGFIEPLGNCGREVMLWWVRVEARADSRYPSRWVLESPLEMTVEAKRTPWPEYVEQNETSSSSNRNSRKLDPSSDKHRSSKSQRSGGRRAKRRQDTQLQQQEVAQKQSIL